MPTTSSVRIDDELFAAAAAAAAVTGRSTAQQLAHWARIGQELESSPAVSAPAIRSVLAGERPYDGLSDEEQVVVRVTWAQRLAEARDGVDLVGFLDATGVASSELDADGALVTHEPGDTAVPRTGGTPFRGRAR